VKTREDLSYYDGPLSGLLWDDGEPTRYFVMQENSPLYPTERYLEGRIYDVWVLDEELTDVQLDEAWWTPERPPDGSMTEDEVYSYQHV